MARLAAAPDPDAARRIESELAALWSRSGSPALDLLLRRGQDALKAGEAAAAVEHLTAAIDHDPTFAEAYVARAAGFYLLNQPGPALDDLREALVLNPHHWEAMKGFALLLEEIGRPEAALEVWRRVTEINPQDAIARSSADRLALSLEGRAI
ncbi:hypothetical protein GT358_01525 [Rubellimicrobium sp. CFH 75288]|nr:hypothetical protein [Rubellimicrobium sp. CFH 75288]